MKRLVPTANRRSNEGQEDLVKIVTKFKTNRSDQSTMIDLEETRLIRETVVKALETAGYKEYTVVLEQTLH